MYKQIEKLRKRLVDVNRKAHVLRKPIKRLYQLRQIEDGTLESDVQRMFDAFRNGQNHYIETYKLLVEDFEVDPTGLNNKLTYETKLKTDKVIDDEDITKIDEFIKVELERRRLKRLPLDEKPHPPYESELTRKAAFVYNNPSSWEINDVAYLNGMDSSIGGASDAEVKLSSLKSGSLKGNTRTSSNSLLVIDTLMHNHVQAGSWGIAFYYKKEDDFTITPYVIDVAYGRQDNKYNWSTGGSASYEPTNANLP